MAKKLIRPYDMRNEHSESELLKTKFNSQIV